MAEFVYSKEKIIGVDEPITLENNTGANFDVRVGVGIIFQKSGLYRVSVDGKHTSIEIEPEWKKGKWIYDNPNTFRCSKCNKYLDIGCGNMKMNFCPNCGSWNIEENE